MPPLNVGLIGCGAISDIYLTNARRFAPYMQITHCADLLPERARNKATKYGIACCSTVDELLANPAIDIILNLTVPLAHADISVRALQAGKHIYSEKPLATTLADARTLLELASEKGLRAGSAPDTFLGASQQAARAAIDAGALGKVIGGCAFMLTTGVESWHPDPEFFYKPGGGPLFDMGPYYISALVNLLGPITRVCASAQMPMPVRSITSMPKAGQQIDVEVPTHVSAILDFASGAVITLTTSFDVATSSVPNIELFGTKATMQVPDPNTFSGPLKLRFASSRWWKKVPQRKRAYQDNSRSVGLADMAHAIEVNRPHRAGAELSLHTVEVMEAIHTSSSQNTHVNIQSQPPRPDPFPENLSNWKLN